MAMIRFIFLMMMVGSCVSVGAAPTVASADYNASATEKRHVVRVKNGLIPKRLDELNSMTLADAKKFKYIIELNLPAAFVSMGGQIVADKCIVKKGFVMFIAEDRWIKLLPNDYAISKPGKNAQEEEMAIGVRIVSPRIYWSINWTSESGKAAAELELRGAFPKNPAYRTQGSFVPKDTFEQYCGMKLPVTTRGRNKAEFQFFVSGDFEGQISGWRCYTPQ